MVHSAYKIEKVHKYPLHRSMVPPIYEIKRYPLRSSRAASRAASQAFSRVSTHPVLTHANAVQRAFVSWDDRRSCPKRLSSFGLAASFSMSLILPERTDASRHGPTTENRASATASAPSVTSLSRAPSTNSSFVPEMLRWPQQGRKREE